MGDRCSFVFMRESCVVSSSACDVFIVGLLGYPVRLAAMRGGLRYQRADGSKNRDKMGSAPGLRKPGRGFAGKECLEWVYAKKTRRKGASFRPEWAPRAFRLVDSDMG